jgi:phage-related protein
MVMEITPLTSADGLTISGIQKNEEEVTVYGLVTGIKIMLDGEKGIFTNGNSLADIRIWSLPVLSPGDNTIKVSSRGAELSIRFRPRFM